MAPLSILGKKTVLSAMGAGVAFLCSVGLNALIMSFRLDEIPSSPKNAERRSPLAHHIFSFGNLPATVDWLLLRFLVDGSIEPVKKGEHTQVFYNLDLATDLDPLFYEIYLVGSNFLTVIRDDNLGALKLANKGDQFRQKKLSEYPLKFQKGEWGGHWELSLVLTYLHLFEFQDLVKGSEVLAEVESMPEAPLYVRLLAKRLKSRDGQIEVGFRVLESMYSRAKKLDNAEMLKQVEQKFQALQVFKYFHELNLKFAALKAPFSKLQAQGLIPQNDPWGGRIYFDESQKKISSTTPRQSVMGLE
jgi:hypothetical protein